MRTIIKTDDVPKPVRKTARTCGARNEDSYYRCNNSQWVIRAGDAAWLLSEHGTVLDTCLRNEDALEKWGHLAPQAVYLT